jgi:hypothetical protein
MGTARKRYSARTAMPAFPMSETRMFPDGVSGRASARGLCFSRKSGLLSDVLQYCI